MDYKIEMIKRTEEDQEERRGGVELSLPWGASIKIRGISMLLTLVLVAVVAVGVISYFHERETLSFEDGIRQILMDMNKQQKAMTDREAEMNYILTLPADKREKLNLEMPDSLRNKLRDHNE